MPNITAPAFSFPSKSFPAQQAGAPAGAMGELSMSELLGKYASLAKSGKMFYTSAIITAPVIFSTAAQLGPIIWNKAGSGLDAHLLAVGVGSPTTATTVAGALGWAAVPQTTLPTSQTAITTNNAYAGGGASQMASVGTGGTVIVLPAPIFLPLTGVVNTAGVTTTTVTSTFVDVGGALIV